MASDEWACDYCGSSHANPARAATVCKRAEDKLRAPLQIRICELQALLAAAKRELAEREQTIAERNQVIAAQAHVARIINAIAEAAGCGDDG